MKSKEVKEFRLGELFCGPGGLAYAAVNSQIEDSEYKIIHKWSNDYDLDTCKTYTRNICPNDPESVICGDVRKLDIEPLGDIDALAFGFPCNDFSVVGEQKGFNGTFGPLYSYGIKVLKRYKPLWFLAENVGGLKSANEGKAFEKIKEDMIEAGYRIYPNLYKFEQYGVPQPRQNAFTADIPEELQLKVKGAKISQIYKRLNPTKPAYTVTGSGGGGTHIYHYDEPRALTNRERARLQTFPDDYVFEGSKESVRKQIGMAVPQKGARVIFEAILKTFAGISYESIDAYTGNDD